MKTFDFYDKGQIATILCRKGNGNMRESDIYVKSFAKQKLPERLPPIYVNNTRAKCYLVQSIQVDSERGISAPSAFGKQPSGTWFVSLWFENENEYKQVKNSVSVLQPFINQLQRSTQPKAFTKFGELLTADKTAIMTYDGKTPEVSKKVRYIIDGESYDVQDGIHIMKDGSKIETKDSFITAIIPAEKKPTAKEQPTEALTKQPKAWTREQTAHFMCTGQTPNQVEFAQRNAEWRRRYGL